MHGAKTGLLFAVIGVGLSAALWAGAGQAGSSGAGRALTKPVVSTLKVDRLDPGLDRIVPAGAQVEQMAAGYTWLEGPVWDGKGLIFADITGNSIRRLTPEVGITTILHPSGYKGSAPYGGPEPGSNGNTLDARGRLTSAGHAGRNVFRLESNQAGAQVTILADSYQGKKLNSPNDVVYKSDGSLYFTDPPYGLRTQGDNDPEKELKVNGVYRIPHATAQKPGAEPARNELQLLVSDLPRPNGIAFSPDEKYLYVDNSVPQKRWMRYTVKPDGTLTDAKLLYDATADNRPGVPDGMKVDMEGNIYSAGPGGVWIFTPEGKPLGTLLIPMRVSNVAWAGADRKTLYITGAESIYRVRLNIAGEPLEKR